MARLSQRGGLLLLAAASLLALLCVQQFMQQRALLWRTADASDGGHALPRNKLVGDEAVGTNTPWSEQSVATAAPLAEQLRPRPWFLEGGSRWMQANHTASSRLWPHQAPHSDRIIDQLMFLPPLSDEQPRVRKVLMYHGMVSWWQQRTGPSAFQHCPVSSCTFTANKSEASDADAIVFHDRLVIPDVPRPARQVWILYHMESPMHTEPVKEKDVFNWTATYRRDSDIVSPYGRWVYYDDRVRQKPQTDFNFAANKTKKVAWFVSNCKAHNKRLEYAHELQKHIQVDIFGGCGTKKCPRSDSKTCFEMLDRDYKFYLAFENSNCKDYITEKLYSNALKKNVLPVVMGARPEDYAQCAPERSYIHVDEFASAEELAEYLHQLDTDDELYNSYFHWKGTGEFINTHFFCRLCALLHDDFPDKAYSDINEWWRGPGTCTGGSWRNATHE